MKETAKFSKVAVIGAGAAGLVAARELHREGLEVVVFEQSANVGGTWVYDPHVESDPLGLDPNRKVVHSSMYLSLRTNLPRELMGFLDYPFGMVGGRDCRRFPGHKEVALYLEDFAAEFDVLRFIRFRTEVEYVGMVTKNQWFVRSCSDKINNREEVYDAVVVCNGHHTQPRIAQIPGIEIWPGKQIHSHNYRVPDSFRDEVVVIIGNSYSGEDIALELTGVTKQVHISARSRNSDVLVTNPVDVPYNIFLHPEIKSLCQDGTVNFEDGTSIVADSIIHCTGYSYYFPFLDTKGIVTVNDNSVGPLYEHVFPPLLAPSLSFVGLPWQAIPFVVCELQSKWIAHTLSRKAILPSKNDMMEAVKDFYARNETAGQPRRYTHILGSHQGKIFPLYESICYQ
ncbi:flavin-containing monooxygenase FMO GS-OX5 isoform X2 [Cryptomeria japonica]|uniref:flavin-containing monooxygenase FMO GS-OX5 isoform X2 n=1 Tax=Cryptomeria japonica TaxID=3369 RepID=UPI0027D9FAD0|nr:flavin-containing monooxygenase FMO GS-OX5 isoform X2 [Cryptomeria japonica]